MLSETDAQRQDAQEYSRREFAQLGGAALASAAMLGAGAGTAAAQESVTPNFDSDYLDDPYIPGTVQVSTHEPGFAELDYVGDDGSTRSLNEHGIVLAQRPDDGTPHNPVTLAASDIDATEYTAFPRGGTYDDDNDSSTDEVPVSALDATHWSTTGATNGTITVSDDGDSLVISTSSVADGETVKATLDLSTVASDDLTITDGMSRKFLQLVADIDSLPSGSLVEVALIDSSGSEVVANASPSTDTSTEAGLFSATGASQVGQARAGELEEAQSTTLADIERVQIRVSDASAKMTLHGLNAERESLWVFGREEYTDADGNLDLQDVEEPSGDYTITSLSTIQSPFDSEPINGVSYDVEMRASELPSDQVHARVTDAPTSYDRKRVLEVVPEYEWPSAYALDVVTADNFENETAVAPSRYLTVEVATAISDIDPADSTSTIWEQVDDISWTDRSSSVSSVGSTYELLTSVASTDRTAAHWEVNLSESEVDTATGSGSSGGAVAASGGSGGNGIYGLVAGVIGGLAIWKRKALLAVFGGS